MAATLLTEPELEAKREELLDYKQMGEDILDAVANIEKSIASRNAELRKMLRMKEVVLERYAALRKELDEVEEPELPGL